MVFGCNGELHKNYNKLRAPQELYIMYNGVQIAALSSIYRQLHKHYCRGRTAKINEYYDDAFNTDVLEEIFAKK